MKKEDIIAKISHLLNQIVSDINGVITTRDEVDIKCQCGRVDTKRVYKLYTRWPSSPYRCQTCYVNDPINKIKHRESTSNAAKRKWTDPEYRQKRSKIAKSLGQDKRRTAKLRKQAKERWNDPEYRCKITASNSTKEAKIRSSEASKKAWSDPEYASKVAKSIKAAWTDPNRREKASKISKSLSSTPESIIISSIKSKERWADPKYRETMSAAQHTPEYLRNKSEKSKKMWGDPKFLERAHKLYGSVEFRTRASHRAKELWKDPEYRRKIEEAYKSKEYLEKMAAARSNMPKVSSLQTILYSLLDDLDVKYYREYLDQEDDPECTIGPYNFDCVVPREGRSSLLIECQGDYWHSKEKAVRMDRSKSSYISNNLSDQYELKYLWEHEFKCKDKIVETIKHWLGIGCVELIDFNFDDIEIKECYAKDYKLLLSKYHYLANAGRGGIAYGAYLKEELIAVCVFSPPIRQNISKSQGCKDNEIRELSRLCIHPRYQKKNFASWFVSRCIKLLNPKYRRIVSYCDTTFNHDGAIYKACNFKLDGTIRPDYWYVDKDGWVMHKKTLYNHAQKFRMKEKDYADKKGYKKIYGKKKLRFIFDR